MLILKAVNALESKNLSLSFKTCQTIRICKKDILRDTSIANGQLISISERTFSSSPNSEVHSL